MGKYAKRILVLVLAVILGFVLGKCTDEKEETKTRIIIQKGKVDSIPVPVPVLVESTTYELLPTHILRIVDTVDNTKVIDTLALLADYMTKKYYDQVLVDNDTLYFRLKQVVLHNSIVQQSVPEYRTYNTVTEKTIYKYPTRFGVGVQINFDFDEVLLNASLILKQKYSIDYSYNATQNVHLIGGKIYFGK